MIHYAKIVSKEHGLLVFKVIGTDSQEHAEKIVMENLGESLMRGRTMEGPSTTICPLFCDFETAENAIPGKMHHTI